MFLWQLKLVIAKHASSKPGLALNVDRRYMTPCDAHTKYNLKLIMQLWWYLEVVPGLPGRPSPTESLTAGYCIENEGHFSCIIPLASCLSITAKTNTSQGLESAGL